MKHKKIIKRIFFIFIGVITFLFFAPFCYEAGYHIDIQNFFRDLKDDYFPPESAILVDNMYRDVRVYAFTDSEFRRIQPILDYYDSEFRRIGAKEIKDDSFKNQFFLNARFMYGLKILCDSSLGEHAKVDLDYQGYCWADRKLVGRPRENIMTKDSIYQRHKKLFRFWRKPPDPNMSYPQNGDDFDKIRKLELAMNAAVEPKNEMRAPSELISIFKMSDSQWLLTFALKDTSVEFFQCKFPSKNDASHPFELRLFSDETEAKKFDATYFPIVELCKKLPSLYQKFRIDSSYQIYRICYLHPYTKDPNDSNTIYIELRTAFDCWAFLFTPYRIFKSTPLYNDSVFRNNNQNNSVEASGFSWKDLVSKNGKIYGAYRSVHTVDILFALMEE